MQKPSPFKSISSNQMSNGTAITANDKRFSSDALQPRSSLSKGGSPNRISNNSNGGVKTIYIDWSKYPKPNKPLPRLPRSPALPTTKPPSRTVSPPCPQRPRPAERKLPELPRESPEQRPLPTIPPQEPINFSEPPAFHAPRVPQQQLMKPAVQQAQQNTLLQNTSHISEKTQQMPSNQFEESQQFQVDDTDMIFVQTAPDSRFLKAASLEKLCQYILTGTFSNSDSNFIHTIVYTFENFSSVDEFIGTLLECFTKIISSSNADETKLANTRLVEFFFSLSNHLQYFFGQRNNGKSKYFEKVKTILSKYIGDNKQLEKTILMSLSQDTAPFTTKSVKINFGKININDISFAQQVTLREWHYFLDIKNPEFYAYVSNRREAATHLSRLVEWTNTFSTWLSVYVLSETNLTKRAAALNRVFTLADNLLKMHNFNGAMEVYSSVSHSAIYRLKQTWEKISKKSQEIFQNLETIFSTDKNMLTYRQTLKSSPYPKIPFIGFVLTDLIFINEGIKKDFLEYNGKQLIHVEKWKKVGRVMTDVLICREYDPYDFEIERNLLALAEPHDALKLLTAGITTEPLFSDEDELLFTDSELLKLSKTVEPKQ